jgi:hypothetical protein
MKKDKNNVINLSNQKLKKSIKSLKYIKSKTVGVELTIDALSNELSHMIDGVMIIEEVISKEGLIEFDITEISKVIDLLDDAEYLLRAQILKKE